MAQDRREEPRALVWEGLDEARLEFALINLTPVELRASVTQLGTSPIPYRLSYELTTATGFRTQELVAVAEGAGWRRRLELRRGADGAWSSIVESKGEAALHPVEDLPDLSDTIDCDVGRSPLTNTLPVLRLGLLEGGAAELAMAWVSVPDLRVLRSEQRYEFVSAEHGQVIIRYVGRHRSYVGDLTFDRDGLVLDYPDLARRLLR
ncbi:MAG: putative glycolipid-binding domain-containing protein [Egibacteraceae bacterium]